jgi:hypothetical protein
VLTAVAGQLTDGATVHVQAHLARTATWLLDHPDDASRALPDVDDLMVERSTPSGLLRYPPPAFSLDDGPEDWPSAGSPWAADAPVWRTDDPAGGVRA